MKNQNVHLAFLNSIAILEILSTKFQPDFSVCLSARNIEKPPRVKHNEGVQSESYWIETVNIVWQVQNTQEKMSEDK